MQFSANFTQSVLEYFVLNDFVTSLTIFEYKTFERF